MCEQGCQSPTASGFHNGAGDGGCRLADDKKQIFQTKIENVSRPAVCIIKYIYICTPPSFKRLSESRSIVSIQFLWNHYDSACP